MSFSPSFLAPALSAAGVICLVAVLPMPYGWYMLTRWVVCAASIAAALHWYGRSDKIAVVAMVIALLFNPIQPIALGRPLWMLVDVLVGAVALWLGWRLRNGTSR
ncbi:hypothetical protein RHOFW104R8_06980 [Rhodanobacter sp. FW104-R8]|nr:hypothetical protein RHOFW104R8_06980 [Rhodanobacter sp. FW104-R8]KZC25751.1 hypothetical protein RhoFW510T8_06050 [Rhodanobacter sp. FW510-T8]